MIWGSNNHMLRIASRIQLEVIIIVLLNHLREVVYIQLKNVLAMKLNLNFYLNLKRNPPNERLENLNFSKILGKYTWDRRDQLLDYLS